MFFDYKESDEEPAKKHVEFESIKRGKKEEWRRIKRPVYSKFWRLIHNLIAHPMLAIHRPTGQKLHDWTAENMYKPSGDIISESD